MIIRDKPHAWQLLFVLRGSIVPTIAPRVSAVTALAVLIVVLEARGTLRLHEIVALPFSLIGIALSIFVGFRNSACYDRWWEGRKVFGQLLVDTRSLARQSLALLAPRDPERARRAALRCAAFAYLLRDRLRAEPPGEEARATLTTEDSAILAARNPPNLLLLEMGREIASAAAAGQLTAQAGQVMEERLVSLSGVLAAAERIRGVPVPYTYTLMIHRTVYLFCLLLPFGLAGAAGAWTPLMVAIVSYTFFGLDALGDELEAPFGRGQNALPLSAMARGLEIDIREMLGDDPLPDERHPIDYILS